MPLRPFILLLTCLAGSLFGAQPGLTVSVIPEETDELLPSPGMGWQTFGRFADEDKALQGLPSTSAYFRFYWRELEPDDGAIDFKKLDGLLAHAHRAGQKLAFRIMCTGSGEYMDVPAWLKEQGCAGYEFTYEGRRHWVPDFTDPKFQKAHSRLVQQLGSHYDGHPDLDLVDIGSVGLWGEWHMSDTKAIDTGKPVPLPPLETRMAIITAWRDAFSRTSRVVLIGSEEGMARTAAEHLGWRADCLGDMGGFSKTWNHMDNFYLQQLQKTGAEQAWLTGPVAFESCWDMRKWQEAGWDIRHIFDYALRCHASYLNNKSAPLPEGVRPEIERFLRRIGYRLVLRKLEHPAQINAGHKLAITAQWENVGVAPPYRSYPIGYRLTPQDKARAPLVLLGTQNIHGWLPGKRSLQDSLSIPATLSPGRYSLSIAIVDADARMPAVPLAIKGKDSDRWYSLTSLSVLK